MRRFTATCIDNKTRKPLILSGCSYNNACFYLSSLGFECTDTKIDRKNDVTEIIGTLKGRKRIFWYDEFRGLLLGE